jgi:poly(A) polymerase
MVQVRFPWEAYLQNGVFDTAKQIVVKLRQAGHEAYFVGGSVRDILSGRTPQEFDIVTSASPEDVRGLFSKTIPLGERFGIMLVIEAGHPFEVATYRTENDYLDGRRPSRVTLSRSAEQDVQRRDFTINGLLMDPLSGQILDFVNGREDLEARIIRTIGDPDERFSEDHLRMLRAVRFAANLRYEIDPGTLSAVKKNASLIRRISAERVRDELTKILTRGDSRRGFELLADTGLLTVLLPEVEAMQSVSQPECFHPEGDVWEHTLRMLLFLSDLEDRMRADVRLAWGVLLHDIGKPETWTRNETGIHFYGHCQKGAELAESILLRLRFSRADSETVLSLIRNHMHFMNVMQMRSNRLKRFLRMPDFELHLELHRLDCLASHGFLESYEFCKAKLSEMPREVLRPTRLLTGNDLKTLGFKPGPIFSEILRAVEDAQLEAELQTREDAVTFVRKTWGKEADS